MRPTRLLALLPALLLLAALAPVPSARAVSAAPRHVIVSAHRGGAAYEPENTLPAFQHALKLGVDQLEMDTQLTSDGKLVIIHDDTLNRTTNCTGTVQSHTLAQVETCDAGYWFTPGVGVSVDDPKDAHPMRGKGVRIPTAQQVFDLVKRSSKTTTISIEIKDIPGESNFDATGTKTADVLIPFIKASGLADRTIVQSFWPTVLTVVHRMDSSLKTQFLTTSNDGQTAEQNLAVVIADGDTNSSPNSDAPDVDQTFVNAVHAAGKLYFPYTPDTRTQQRQALAIGADGIITNWPACTLDLEGRRHEQPGDCPRDLAKPTAAQCAAITPRQTPATGTTSTKGDLRVIGIQYKQQVSNVTSYTTFKTAIACLFQDYVVPHEVRGRPTLVVLNEDIGLMTIAEGLRGKTARTILESPVSGAAGDQAPAPAGALAALAQVNATYAPQVAAYQARLGPIIPTKEVFVAATDTFARVFSQTFSDAARQYGVYVVASNNQPTYEESFGTADIAAFRDPSVTSGPAYVATSQVVHNTTFLWGPKDVHPKAPDGETNLLFSNAKVPLTPFEADDLMLDEGPTTGQAAITNVAGYVVAGHRLGFATSFPAFMYGYAFGAKRPAKPCADIAADYMPCMDSLGVDTVIQAEANDGRWSADAGSGAWQPLEWMESSWRAVSDPTVHFRYAVNPMMVGNLADLPFDGQSAIFARNDPQAFQAHYVGTLTLQGTDPPADGVYAGSKPGFLALAPWDLKDGSRASLSAESAALAPASGSPEENDYLQTAVYADLLPKAAAVPTKPTEPTEPTTIKVSPTTAAQQLPHTGADAALSAAGLVLLVLLALGRRRPVKGA